MKQLSEKFHGTMRFGGVDCNEDEEMCEEFSVYETPAVIVFSEKMEDEGEKIKGKIEWKKVAGSASKKM